ncbi:MAG TPA: hypothetical protein VFN25_10140 [Dokdonella sp.]|uniref:hypothetical protein n=1 Tax=Dokdonella sp. TaxID=2291710 RepID=UPI002D7F6FC1|nr:hypothetical protein [Dokdonella sp.]HET9033254.1 hypothetical protein [Dokdonella sp.]
MFVFQSSLRPRNPLVRLIGGILGLFVVVGLIALGFFAFIALFIGGAIWYVIHIFRAKRQRRPQPKAAKAEDGVIDGEFTVVGDSDRRLRIDQPKERGEHRR